MEGFDDELQQIGSQHIHFHSVDFVLLLVVQMVHVRQLVIRHLSRMALALHLSTMVV